MDLLIKPRRRRVFSLQLTAMIDIFSILVIFLVRGTVFNVSDIVVPKDVRLPESLSRESVESAPNVVISERGVQVWTNEGIIEHRAFEGGTRTQEMLDLKAKLLIAVQKISHGDVKTEALLNIVADKKVPYRFVYDTVKFFRESGFETVLFVAAGAEKQ